MVYQPPPKRPTNPVGRPREGSAGSSSPAKIGSKRAAPGDGGASPKRSRQTASSAGAKPPRGKKSDTAASPQGKGKGKGKGKARRSPTGRGGSAADSDSDSDVTDDDKSAADVDDDVDSDGDSDGGFEVVAHKRKSARAARGGDGSDDEMLLSPGGDAAAAAAGKGWLGAKRAYESSGGLGASPVPSTNLCAPPTVSRQLREQLTIPIGVILVPLPLTVSALPSVDLARSGLSAATSVTVVGPASVRLDPSLPSARVTHRTATSTIGAFGAAKDVLSIAYTACVAAAQDDARVPASRAVPSRTKPPPATDALVRAIARELMGGAEALVNLPTPVSKPLPRPPRGLSQSCRRPPPEHCGALRVIYLLEQAGLAPEDDVAAEAGLAATMAGSGALSQVICEMARVMALRPVGSKPPSTSSVSAPLSVSASPSPSVAVAAAGGGGSAGADGQSAHQSPVTCRPGDPWTPSGGKAPSGAAAAAGLTVSCASSAVGVTQGFALSLTAARWVTALNAGAPSSVPVWRDGTLDPVMLHEDIVDRIWSAAKVAAKNTLAQSRVPRAQYFDVADAEAMGDFARALMRLLQRALRAAGFGCSGGRGAGAGAGAGADAGADASLTPQVLLAGPDRGSSAWLQRVRKSVLYKFALVARASNDDDAPGNSSGNSKTRMSAEPTSTANVFAAHSPSLPAAARAAALEAGFATIGLIDDEDSDEDESKQVGRRSGSDSGAASAAGESSSDTDSEDSDIPDEYFDAMDELLVAAGKVTAAYSAAMASRLTDAALQQAAAFEAKARDAVGGSELAGRGPVSLF